MNLLHDPWLPVRRASGAQAWIAPWQITDGFHGAADPIVALNAPRPDFNGSLAQFLVGLLQTVLPPRDEVAWQDAWFDPPSPEDLREKLSPHADAFELDGDGPRFMQAYELANTDEKLIENPIGQLLIDQPNSEYIRRNTDHFVKRDGVVGLCRACAAAALFTLQTNAPEGGRGNLTSMRGGGPLTTLVLGETLWGTVWANVLSAYRFLDEAPAMPDDRSRVFPWLAPTRSGKQGAVTPQDVHPAQAFWNLPRRIRLDFANPEQGVCDVCSRAGHPLVRRWFGRPYGVKYDGWVHPLSPHVRDSPSAAPRPVKGRSGAMSYRHWIGLVVNDREAKRESAAVVHHFRAQRLTELREEERFDLRLWGFGLDMAQMKARGWSEGQMPLIAVAPEYRESFETLSGDMVQAAHRVAGNLRRAVEKALYWSRKVDSKGKTVWERPRGLSTNKTQLFESLQESFWQNTEPVFFEHVQRARDTLGGDEAAAVAVRASWHDALCDEALRLFDLWVQSGGQEHADLKAVVQARRELRNFNRAKGIAQELLGLPQRDKEDQADSDVA